MNYYAIILLVLMTALLGCDKNMDSKDIIPKEKSISNTKLGILPKLISIPKKPISVLWKLDESKSTNRGQLLALLKFTDDDQKYILSKSKEFEKNQNDTISKEVFENWLPDDAKTGIITKIKGDLYELTDIYALQPNLFTNTEVSPYVNGAITPLSSGYILISLYAM